MPLSGVWFPISHLQIEGSYPQQINSNHAFVFGFDWYCFNAGVAPRFTVLLIYGARVTRVSHAHARAARILRIVPTDQSRTHSYPRCISLDASCFEAGRFRKNEPIVAENNTIATSKNASLYAITLATIANLQLANLGS
jgi:hypothetical protein